MSTTKKAQIEMIGLAIIVILLALGMFFVAKFSLSDEGAPSAQVSTQKQVLSQFLVTLLNTDAGCQGSSATFSTLLLELGSIYPTLTCGPSLEEHFESSVTELLNKTLATWNYEYNLTVTYPRSSDRETIAVDHGCVQRRQQDAQRFPIPTDVPGEVITVVLKICY